MIAKKLTKWAVAIAMPVLLTINSFAAGSLTNLGTLDGKRAQAYDINDKGEIVGEFSPSSDSYHAFYYSNGTTKDLDTFMGNDRSFARAINNKSQIVGDAIKGGRKIAFLYSNGSVKDLGGLSKNYSSQANDINESGNVVGYSTTENDNTHAFLYNGTSMKDLGTLGGSNSEAIAINSAGDIVGQSDTDTGEQHAFIYSNGVMKDIGPTGEVFTQGLDINDNGDVVIDSGGQQTYLYSKSTDITRYLGDFGYSNTFSVKSINNKGQMIGSLQNTDWSYNTFLLENNIVTKINTTDSEGVAINELGNVVGNSGPNVFVYSTSSTSTSDNKSPTKPTGLKVASSTTKSVKLSWTASKDNVKVTRYDVYKKSGTLFVKVASSTSNSCTISGLKTKTSYSFYVKACDAAGNNSPQSSTLTVKTK